MSDRVKEILSADEYKAALRTLANWRGEGGHDMADAWDAAIAHDTAQRERVAVLEAGLREIAEWSSHKAAEHGVVGVREYARAVLGGVPATAWAPEIKEWAIVNRALSAEELDRVQELARSMPIADALRAVAQEGDTVTDGGVPATKEEQT